MAASSDGELISEVRRMTGAQDESVISEDELFADLEEIKKFVTTEVQQGLEGGNINLYDQDAPLEIAKHYFAIRVAVKRKRRNSSAVVDPENPEELPDTPSRMRRHNFVDETLGFWRDEAVRNYNRLTE